MLLERERKPFQSMLSALCNLSDDGTTPCVARHQDRSVCVCLREKERERESEDVYVCLREKGEWKESLCVLKSGGRKKMCAFETERERERDQETSICWPN